MGRMEEEIELGKELRGILELVRDWDVGGSGGIEGVCLEAIINTL